MLKLIPPGKRKGNQFWVARGRVLGKDVEFSTRERDKVRAEIRAGEVIAELLAGRAATDPDKVTFRHAAEAYTAWRKPSWRDVGQINKLVAKIGHLPLDSIRGADLVALANELYPTHKESSKNKLVITPCAAILHYAAEQEWCAYRKIKKFREPEAETRAVRYDDAAKLVAAAPAGSYERALLVFLFRQGMRITDAISVVWEKINLQAATLDVRIGKTDRYREKVLHPDVVAAFAALPVGAGRVGKVFPYANRWAVYRALTPLAIGCGVTFTPHMARHSLGKWMNAAGAGQRTIMDALDHKDPKSSIRYQSTDAEVQRMAQAKMPALPGRKSGTDD